MRHVCDNSLQKQYFSLIVRDAFVLVVLAFAMACSSGQPSGPAASDLPQLERRALDLVRQTDSQTDPAHRARILSRFRFSSGQGLREIRKLILDRAAEAEFNDPSPAEEAELVALYWNYVDSISSGTSGGAESLRPFVEDVLLLGASPIEAHALLVKHALEPASFEFRKLAELYHRIESAGSPPHAVYQRHRLELQAHMATLLISGAALPQEPGLVSKAEGLRFLSQSGELARKVLAGSLRERRIGDLAGPLSAIAPAIPSLYWRYSATVLAGRCGSESQEVSGTQIGDLSLGKGCRYGDNGNDSVAQVRLDHLATRSDGMRWNATGAVSSYVRGGYRHGGFLRNPPEENGTSTVRYHARGTVIVPVCENPALCEPTVMVQGGCGAVPGGSCRIVVKSAALAGETQLSDAPVEVDRSRHPIEIEISFGRDFTHVGSWGEPGTQRQAFHLAVVESDFWNRAVVAGMAPARPAISAKELFAGLPERLRDAFGGKSSLHRLSQDLARASSEGPFEDRYLNHYAKLILAQWTIEDSAAPLAPAHRYQLLQAVRAISQKARGSLLTALEALARDREALLDRLPIAQLTEEIVSLMDAEAGALKENSALEVVSDLRLAGEPEIAAETALASESARERSDTLSVAAHLMEIRSRLVELERRWAEEAVLFAVERSQLGEIPAEPPR